MNVMSELAAMSSEQLDLVIAFCEGLINGRLAAEKQNARKMTRAAIMDNISSDEGVNDHGRTKTRNANC